MKILYIDDDADDREIFSEALAKVGPEHLFFTISNTCDVLTKLHDLKPALLVLDINMPAPDGRELLKMIRRDVRFERLCICLFSTWISSEETNKYIALGANYCIKKPNNFGELSCLLKKLIDKTTTESACQTSTT